LFARHGLWSKQKSHEDGTTFKTTYVFGCSYGKSDLSMTDKKYFAEQYVKLAVWQRCREMFQVVKAQYDLDFPDPPPQPMQISWLTNGVGEDD
jgi:hypothetical protein